MNFKMVGFVLGRIFLIEAVLMLCPTLRPVWGMEYRAGLFVAHSRVGQYWGRC